MLLHLGSCRRGSAAPAPALLVLGVCVGVAAFIAAGCAPRAHWQVAASKLDDVAAAVDGFGTVAASEPLLVRDTGQFAIDVNRPVTDYIDAARTGVQGSARRSSERALDVSQKFQARADVTSVFNPLLAAGAAAPAPPTAPPAVDVTLPSDRPARGTLSSPTFTKPLDQVFPTGLSERQALLVGVNDKITEGILKFLVHPGTISSNKKVFVGLLQISCQPGWRTRKGYVADVNIAFSYAKKADVPPTPAAPGVGVKGTTNGSGFVSSLAVPGRVQPFTVAAFPSLESQTLDLRNSVRSQIAFANQLALVLKAGAADAQAQQLIDFANRLENDFASRNPIPVLTSYSNGASLGYQIRPSFQALAEPSSKDAGAGEILSPVSFPALFLLVCEEQELKDWTHVEVLVSSRWVPASKANSSNRFGEADRVANARRMDDAMNELRAAANAYPSEFGPDGISSYTAQELRRRLRLYEFAGVGVTRYSELPRTPAPAGPAAPTIAAVEPHSGWKNDLTVLAIRGGGFADDSTPIVKRVIVGGIDCDFSVAGGGALVATVPSGAFDTGRGKAAAPAQAVTVVTTRGIVTSAPPDVIVFDKERDESPSPTRPTIALQRDALGRVTSVVVSGDDKVSSADLLAAIRSILEHETCCEDVNVIVNGTPLRLGAPRGSHVGAPAATQPVSAPAPAAAAGQE